MLFRSPRQGLFGPMQMRGVLSECGDDPVLPKMVLCAHYAKISPGSKPKWQVFVVGARKRIGIKSRLHAGEGQFVLLLLKSLLFIDAEHHNEPDKNDDVTSAAKAPLFLAVSFHANLSKVCGACPATASTEGYDAHKI